MTSDRRQMLASLVTVALFVLLAMPAPALPSDACAVEDPGESASVLLQRAEQVKAEAQAKEAEAEGAMEREHYPDAYDQYRETMTLVRKRAELLKAAARKAESTKTLSEINKAFRENEQWRRNIKEIIDLLKLSQ